jgi:hypothetical protein
MHSQTYTLHAPIWLYPGKAGWHFVTLPIDAANEINDRFAFSKRGWGSLPVTVKVGQTAWQTSIFPDKESGSYLLPIKATVRKSEQLQLGQVMAFELTVHE